MEESKKIDQPLSDKPANQPGVSKFLTPVAIVMAGIIVASAIIATNSGSKTASDTTDTAGSDTKTAASVNVKDINTDGDPYIGKPDAPAVLIEWTDFQCPFCKQFEQNTLEELKKNYVDQGKLKIVFKDYQFLGPDSTAAALDARAIWELYPDKYFEWREGLYNKQDAENGGFGDEASIREFTKTISGIDVAKVADLVGQKKTEYQTKIDADKEAGTKAGVQGTPGFVTGTQLISGAAAYAKFTQAIDPQLK